MKEKKKEKVIQELLQAKQKAHKYCSHHLQGVVKNIQKLRRQLKKSSRKIVISKEPRKSLNIYVIEVLQPDVILSLGSQEKQGNSCRKQ